jgi:hypothetical protein
VAALRLAEGRLNIGMLKARCHPFDTPLKHLPLAVEAVWQCTGCVWLDADYEQPVDAFWKRSDIDWLREEYEQYQKLTAKMNELYEWMEADYLHMMMAVSTLQSCLQPIEEQQAA